MAANGTRQGVGIVGFGAAACAACCAGPILGILGAAGLLTSLAYLATGFAGLAVALPFGMWVHRRRTRSGCESRTEPTPVELTSRSASSMRGGSHPLA